MRAGFQSLRFVVPVILAALFCSGLGSQEQPKPEPAPPANPSAQQQAPAPGSPAFKATTRLVLVDVVATNGKGEPVTDLEAGDFTLLENGKEQKVDSFSLQLPGAPQSGDTKPALAELPPNVFTNVPRYKKTSVWNVLLLDYMNSQVTSQADLRQQLVKVLDKLPDEPLAVYILTDQLYLLQDFSMDHAALKQLIQGLKNHISPNLDNAKGGHEMERYPAGFLARLRPEQRESVIRSEAQMTEAHTEVRLRETVEALNKIVRNVAALPGRKNLIWVSQAFPFAIEPGTMVKGYDAATKREIDISVPGTANALLDSQVAIYPVDPGGLRSPDEFDPAGRADALGQKETMTGPNNTVSALHNQEDVSHSSVNELAERTGGRAFYNLNDIGDAILRSMHDGATYYTLSYYPTDRNWDGRFRRIMVKVNRNGIKLRYRSGYFALNAATMGSPGKIRAEQDAIFRQAMALDAPVSTSLLFTAKVIPPSPPQNGVVVNFQLQPGVITTESGPDGLQRVSVECAVEAFNNKGEPANAAGNTMAGNLKPEAFEKIAREGFPCRQVLDLHPGKYLLRLGVRDNLSGRIGTSDAMVTVPEPAQN